MRVRDPNGQERTLPAALADPRDGRYTAAVRFDQPGVYTVAADVRRGIGSRWARRRGRCWSADRTSSSASRG